MTIKILDNWFVVGAKIIYNDDDDFYIHQNLTSFPEAVAKFNDDCRNIKHIANGYAWENIQLKEIALYHIIQFHSTDCEWVKLTQFEYVEEVIK